MQVQERLAEAIRYVQESRAMPMSASAIVNRGELVALLEQVRAALPGSLAEADTLLAERDAVLDAARTEADAILAEARDEADRIATGSEVAAAAQAKADRILAAAQKKADAWRVEADDYVDVKLAHFEVVLEQILAEVRQGRERVAGASPYDQLAAEPDEPGSG